MIARFRAKAPSRHHNLPPRDDLAGWLFLMQHYRLPTRLLDWTESPLVACYFAAASDPAIEDHPDQIEDADGALFALSPYVLNELSLGRRVLQLPDDPEAARAIQSAFRGSVSDPGSVLAVRPSEVDIRLMVQLAVLTLHDTKLPLEDLPLAGRFYRKFLVPLAAKQSLRNDLKRIGVRESSLFPDLEHLAHEVGSTKFGKPYPPADVPQTAALFIPEDGEDST